MPFKMQSIGVIKADLGIQKKGPVHAFFTNACYKAMDKYVPRSAGTDGGKLREVVDIQPDKIIYEMPYAHAQYVGYTTGPVHNYTTPGTGPYWDWRMWSAEKDSVIRQVQRYVDRGAK